MEAIYYKFNSNPLEEKKLTPGDFAYDEYGNCVTMGTLGDVIVVIRSVLDDGIKVSSYENPKRSLKGFWAWSWKEVIRNNHQINFEDE